MPTPVITVSQMREWETASWAAGRTETEVIRRVGEILAAKIISLTHAGDFILLLAGKGHNGDDARAAQPHLAGRRVELLNVGEPQNDLPKLDALLAQRPALVVDGLFGIGLKRPLDADWVKLVERVNAAQRPVLAVDVPSGLNADIGAPLGDAIRATVTLACIQPEDFAGFPPRRETAAHKGDFGHVAIIAGSLGFHGAAVLAARGALRAQPGLVTVLPQENIFHPVAAQLQSAMVTPWKPGARLPEKTSAVLVGPGLAAPNLPTELKIHLRQIWMESLMPVVVDASALDWLPLYPLAANFVRVLTPHPGEAARMLKTTVEKIQADRPAALRELSRQFGNCWVVLKGHQTLIGRSNGSLLVNCSGNPQLAQGGSGDVLAGFLAGLVAQRPLQADLLRALAYGVWQHGAAADKLAHERKNWTVEDLAGEIGNA
ncbi:MAG: NAD(P)H-hydrate dehydratase [Verrucomicrobia bacterium]|nr:NAD(P)H-hydrate dehydratase [Verrucomicrobiota bacterium]